VAWKWGKLLAATYPVTLRLYGNGTLAATVAVANAGAFMLPIMRREREWTIDVDAGETDVYELSLGLDADAVRSR
jgi:hypothetical protein